MPRQQQDYVFRNIFKVLNLNLRNKDEAAKAINNFIEEATNGKIKKIVDAARIDDDVIYWRINYFTLVPLRRWHFSSMPLILLDLGLYLSTPRIRNPNYSLDTMVTGERFVHKISVIREYSHQLRNNLWS